MMRGFSTLLPLLLEMIIAMLGRFGTVLAQHNNATDVSCVQVSGTNFTSTCPCGVATMSFAMVGDTYVSNNTVNVAVVLDGSGSVSSTEFLESKEFAKDITAVFATRNLFANGGTASYVQFSDGVDPADTGTFYSLDDFNDFVDANDQIGSGTDIDAGIIAAQDLLNAAPPASAAFMIVLTDGDDNVGGDNVAETGNASRADGITLFAIGVDTTLLEIGGSQDNVFSVDAFQDLEDAVDEIIGSNGTSTIACPTTNATLIVEYGATVVTPIAFPGATVSGDTVTFPVNDLEENTTDFTVMLETCGAAEPVVPVVSIMYSDDEGNSPDFTTALEVANGSTCPPATSPPTSSPTFSPTTSPTLSPTLIPTLSPTTRLTFSPTVSPTFYPTPVIDDPDTCSNGITGVGGEGQCCVLACNKCKDYDCENRAKKAGLTKDDCCPDQISASSMYCEDIGFAPCIVNKPTKSNETKGNKGYK